MGVIPRRAWFPAAVLLGGCNALLGIDEPRAAAVDAPLPVYDAKPAGAVDAPPRPDAPIAIVDARPDAPRPDAPLVDAPAAMVDAAPVDAATVDAPAPDAP